MNRRTFLKRTAAGGGALLGMDLVSGAHHSWAPRMAHADDTRPNILVIMVDQLRAPRWFPSQAELDAVLPAFARLRAGSVSFGQHYTAAAACTPARACLLTGLYSHQTGCLKTILSSATPGLQPGFPTWGTLLRELGYQTYWWGKWHISSSCDLEQYGFSGGTCPSPEGGPVEGRHHDPLIADQFISWLDAQGTTTPWCTTVSFVNPHDICWYYRGTEYEPAYANLPHVFTALPPNFETPTDLRRRAKPRWQSVLQELWPRAAIGELPFDGPGFETNWIKMLDVYLHMQHEVDSQIGRVLDALASHPAAGRTIVLFTADHGEYAGSHGLRGKGVAVYDEGVRIPLLVNDPTGRFTGRPDVERQQLTSSVDIAPLLLTLASGGNEWRVSPRYAHLAGRLDLAAILRDPAARGRPYIVTTCDEDMGADVLTMPAELQGAPAHVIGLRTSNAKLGTYSHWAPGSLAIEAAGQEFECYDYRTVGGRLELDNVAETNPALRDALHAALMTSGIPDELRKPLPDYLKAAHEAGIAAYLATYRAGQQLTRPELMLLFGPQPVGTASSVLTTTLTNRGTTPLTIRGASVVGAQAGSFVASDVYIGSLAPGAHCTIAVTFVPQVAEQCAAVLRVDYDLEESPAAIALHGSGTPNLMANGGFEVGAANHGGPVGWSPNSHVSRTTAVVHSGAYAMQHAASDNASYAIYQAVRNLAAGTTYEASAWVHIPATGDAFGFILAVQWRTGSNTVISTVVLKSYSRPTHGWEQATMRLAAPAGTAYALVVMVALNLNATVYVDDVVFRP